MKKIILFFAVMATMASCSNGAGRQEESPEELKQTQAIEESIQSLDSTMQDSEAMIEKTQNEIDTLLNDI